MIRIALITTWYPPAKGIAVSRMKSFVKYLSLNSDFQIDVYSISVETKIEYEKSNVTNYQFENRSILNSVKASPKDSFLKHNFKTVIRVLLSRIISNRYWFWSNCVLKALIDNHNSKRYDVVISSYSPEEAHLIALDFVKKNKVSWIADMRDEMSKNPGLSKKQKDILSKIENEVDKHATCITSVSKPILDDFIKLCPNVTNFQEIRNGFDHDLNLESWCSSDKTLKIGYFGTFYGERKPDNFFKSYLKIKHQINQKVEFHFYGVHKNFWIPTELKEDVYIFPGVDYLESIQLMSKMDANLLVLPSGIGKGVYSGKIFDYISSKRPILAFVDEDDVAAELINDFNCGYVNDFNDISKGADSLLCWINDIKNQINKAASNEQIQSLHRKNQIKKLEETILKII